MYKSSLLGFKAFLPKSAIHAIFITYLLGFVPINVFEKITKII
jgi:hypothetical protein